MSSNLDRIIGRCKRSTIWYGQRLTPAAKMIAHGWARAYLKASSFQAELPLNARRFLAAEGVLGVPR